MLSEKVCFESAMSDPFEKRLWDFYYFPRGIYDNSIVILAFVVPYHTVFDTEIKY